MKKSDFIQMKKQIQCIINQAKFMWFWNLLALIATLIIKPNISEITLILIFIHFCIGCKKIYIAWSLNL